jgi:hypothetical protein
MEIYKKHSGFLFLVLASFILLISIFKWIDYLTKNNFIVECFTPSIIQEDSGGKTSHTVNLPLTTTYSCKNFCGPTARCAITGQQCSVDIDCPGCQPYTPPLKSAPDTVPGNDEAGKLTVGVTPRYSPLTSGYGTRERVITANMFSKPAMPNFGVNKWMDGFNEDSVLFNKRYKPPAVQFMPNYPERYSLTGEFIEDGPFASNAPIS